MWKLAACRESAHPVINKKEELFVRYCYSGNRIEIECPAIEEETQSNVRRS